MTTTHMSNEHNGRRTLCGDALDTLNRAYGPLSSFNSYPLSLYTPLLYCIMISEMEHGLNTTIERETDNNSAASKSRTQDKI